MIIAIRETVSAWDRMQAAMAKRPGLTQPRLDDLLRRRRRALRALLRVRQTFSSPLARAGDATLRPLRAAGGALISPQGAWRPP
jgi:hypothetical protein